MALEGSLRDFGLADILQLIYFQKKTGILLLASAGDKVKLVFHNGTIVTAESKKTAEENRYGKILAKKGLIKEDELKTCLEEQKTTKAHLGEIIVRKGLIPQSGVIETLTAHMTEIVFQLFSWKEGTYEFSTESVSLSKEVPIMLDTQHLLMDGLRKVDEWSLLEGRITLDTVFRKTGITGFSLTADEENILEFVDGENDVSMIVDFSRMHDLEASKAFTSLLEKGLIEPVAVAPVKEMFIAETIGQKRSFAGIIFLVSFIIMFTLSVGLTIRYDSRMKGEFGSLLNNTAWKAAQTMRDIDRLRFMVEVFRYRNKAYPKDLGEIGRAFDAWGRPYHYSTENDTLVIISGGADGSSGTSDDLY